MSKYGAIKTRYNGRTYASKAEAEYAGLLDMAVQSGIRLSSQTGPVYFWVPQPFFTLGVPENTYRPDFLVVGEDGVWAVDVKGMETAAFKRNKKLWAAYGPCPLRIVKRKGKAFVETETIERTAR